MNEIKQSDLSPWLPSERDGDSYTAGEINRAQLSKRLSDLLNERPFLELDLPIILVGMLVDGVRGGLVAGCFVVVSELVRCQKNRIKTDQVLLDLENLDRQALRLEQH